MPPSDPLPPTRKLAAAAAQLASRVDERSVLFSSFAGRFSDNPRAVFEELATRSAGREPVWVAGDGVTPPGATTVAPRSLDYARALGRAATLVSNEALPYLVKRPGQTYLQTWHGTMLKRIGYDNPRYADDRSGLGRAARDYGRWDLLLSQSPYCTRTMRGAFRYDGEVLEVGYPRNDVLLTPGAEDLRRATRQAYGVPDGVLLVLYAPTFRDGQPAGQRLPLDLTLLQQAFGDSAHVLSRLHHRAASVLGEPPSPFWTSATDHPDIRDLYLAADVLVTDYSSVMFDFAVTGKPMVFFAYDLEAYRDSLRGFYFDLIEQAPGPVCRTTAEVAEALGDLAAVQRAHGPSYSEFRRTYVPWDDGRAAARVVDRLLAG